MSLPAALAILLLPALLGCATTTGYLWKQGGHLLRDSRGAKKVSALLRNPVTPQDTRRLLEDVQDIQAFAYDRVGLERNRNYTRYKELERDHLVEVVQACDALSFRPYTWSYPLVGKLPYRGFYEPVDAKAEAERLRGQGLDVIVREVEAFSTLGVLGDRLFSFMKGYPLHELAALILHEQTHATVFLKGQARFNEQLATFVGEEGALQYVAGRYGRDSRVYRDAVAAQADSNLFLEFIQRLKAALEELYAGPLPREEKLAEKQRIIAEHQRRFAAEYLPAFHDPAYRRVTELPLNNAYLSLYDLYTADLPLLRRYYVEVCGSDLSAFVAQVKRLARGRGEVLEEMSREMAQD